MMQDGTGTTLSLADITPLQSSQSGYPSTDQDERSTAWFVDPKIQYGSIGGQQSSGIWQLGFIYPANEGPWSYETPVIKGVAQMGWVRRSHPVAVGQEDAYSLLFNVNLISLASGGPDVPTALEKTWQYFYTLWNPPIQSGEPPSTVYTDGIALFKAESQYYWIQGGVIPWTYSAEGLPWSKATHTMTYCSDRSNGYTSAFDGTGSNCPSGYSVSGSDTADTPPVPVSYQMGYTGEQLPAAYQLLRYGLQNNDVAAIEEGTKAIDFWVQFAGTALASGNAAGLPLTWTNQSPTSTFRDDNCVNPVFLRTASDGMEGVLHAAELMRQYGQPMPTWESFVTSYGSWLAANQNTNGSFFRAYNSAESTSNPGEGYSYVTGSANQNNLPCNSDGASFKGLQPNTTPGVTYPASTTGTTHPIRFLVGLYFAQGVPAGSSVSPYLTAAINAGCYAYANINAVTDPDPVCASINNNIEITTAMGGYRGGTTDNPDTIDREAGVEALHGFLALYDATQDSYWLDAAVSAADFVETWLYSWNFSIQNFLYPQIAGGPLKAFDYAGTQGSSLVATGLSASDIFLSFEAYNFFRLHLLTADPNSHYLTIAEFLQNNATLTTQYSANSNQTFGYAQDGFAGEATDLSLMEYVAGGSATSPAPVDTWLPWLTEAEIEPLQQFQDTFGNMSIANILTQSSSTLQSENTTKVYPAPGSIGWQDGLGLSNPGFELPGEPTNAIPGWNVYPSTVNSSGADVAYTESSSSAPSHNGNFHLTEFSVQPFTVTASQTLYVPNGTYTVTAWVECSGGLTASMIISGANAGQPNGPSACISASSYEPISSLVSVTTGTMTIGFSASDSVGGHWLRVDDVNVIANPIFETPGSAGVSPPTGWSVWVGSGLASYGYTENCCTSYDSTWHLAQFSNSGPYDISDYQDLLVSNGPHTVSAWVECNGTSSHQVELQVHNYVSPDMFTSALASCSNSSAYTQLSVPVTVTQGRLTVGLYSWDGLGIGTNSKPNPNWARWDDVTVQ
jgi:hypothetical protein